MAASRKSAMRSVVMYIGIEWSGIIQMSHMNRANISDLILCNSTVLLLCKRVPMTQTPILNTISIGQPTEESANHCVPILKLVRVENSLTINSLFTNVGKAIQS